MKLEFLNQSVQYKFMNEARYGKNGKSRIYANVKQNADADSLNVVGHAIAELQGDDLGAAVLITKQSISNN